jgi:hypothetical protein
MIIPLLRDVIRVDAKVYFVSTCQMGTTFWSENRKGRDNSGRPRRRWEDNIRMDLWEINWKIVDRMHLAEDGDQWRILVNTVMNLRVP